MLKLGYNTLILLLALVVIINCNSQKESVKSQIISQDYYEYSGFKDPETLLIKDQDTWNRAHDQIFQNQTPKPGEEVIDFKTYNIVLFSFGEKSHGGYSYDVKSYVQNGDTLTFKIETPTRDPYAPVTMAFTYPVVVCKINATNAKVADYQLKDN